MQILNIWKNYEGNLDCQDISEKNVDNWTIEISNLFKSKNILFEYNFLNSFTFFC